MKKGEANEKRRRRRFAPVLCTVFLLLLPSLLSGCGRETGLPDASSAAFFSTAAKTPLLSESEKLDGNETPPAESGALSSGPQSMGGDRTLSSGPESSEGDAPAGAAGVSGSGKDAQKLPAGALCVNGTSLEDGEGNPVQLRGISTHGIAWYPDYINEECFRQLRDEWNVNVIRLAMYTAEYGGYCSGGDQEQLKRYIRDGVEYATALNLYVIIDWHILSDGNPNTHKEEAKAFFAEMAGAYADYGNVLYEICNEPNGGTTWSQIKSYAEEIIPVIRACDEDGVIIVGTPNWSQYVDQAAADPIAGYDNIMYALHFYAATHRDSLRNTMTAAIDAGLPIFVTEYGICDASGNGAIDEVQAGQWISVMDEYNVSYVAWNLSNKSETSAILSSGCARTSGFAESDLSASGKWLYHMLTEKEETSVLAGSTSSGAPAGSTGTTPPGASAGSTVATPPAADSTIPSGTAPSTAPAAPTLVPGSGADNPGVSDNEAGNNNAGSGNSCGSFSYTATLVNSWESDGRTFSQYNLTVSNLSDAACAQWAIDVTFQDTPTLSDSWNGYFSVNDRTLHISSRDYNGSIPPGGSTGNIGFIVSGGGGLQAP